jgi:hypothetical protein
MYRQVKGPSRLADSLGGPSLVGGGSNEPRRSICCCPNRSGPRHNLNIGRRLARRGHNRPMEPVRGETSPGRPGKHGVLGGKRAADARALAMLPTIRKLVAAGFVSQRGMANQLNRRGIPGAGGGRWHRTTVVRMLTRLSLLTSGQGGINNGLASKRVADVRAEALGPTILKLRKAGFVSISAIARELNERGIPTARGGKWRLTSVTRLLQRLKRLEASSRTGATPTSDAEPKARPISRHQR